MSRKKFKGHTRKGSVMKVASSDATTVSRLRMSSMGTLALSQVQVDSNKMKAEECRWPAMVGTVESMKQDATVASALEAKYIFVEKAFKEFKILFNEDSKDSKEAAAFIEFILKNMDGTLRKFARSAATFNEYGFSVFEKVYAPIKEGQYAGKFKIKSLGFRPQASLAKKKPFLYSDNGNEFLGVNQSASAFSNITDILRDTISRIMLNDNSIFIPANKLMVLTTGGTDSKGMGESPLVGCYRAWREKVLIENLEVVGATKDLGGIIELKIPSMILNKAAIDPSSPEAEMVEGLMRDAANAHAGEQAFFMLPSDMKDNSPLYSMTLKGIDGNGKQYSTQDLITARKKSILDMLGAGFLNVGNDQQGSYNLSESKQSIHYQYVQKDVDIILEALNTNLIPQVLALNGISLSEADMPRVKAGIVSEISMEEFSKAIQRIGAVGYLPKTPEVINKILEVLGIDFKVDLNMSQDELNKILGEDVSRSGDGLKPGTSGQGTGKASATRDNSVSNMDN